MTLFLPCPECGTPTPAPEIIQPCGVLRDLKQPWKTVIPWRCPGALAIDEDLLRYGIIARAPWSCGIPRATKWQDATFDLRHRALLTERLRLAMEGLI